MANEITKITPATGVDARSPSLPRAALLAATAAGEYVTGAGYEWTARAARRELGALVASLQNFISTAEEAVRPVDGVWLRDRLSTMQLASSATVNWSAARATAWLEQTARLLSDLPQDILSAAIDEAIKAGDFLPDVGDIRAIAEPRVAERHKVLTRLRAMRDYERPPSVNAEPVASPDEVAAIIEEMGLRAPAEVAAIPRHVGAPRYPTREEQAEFTRSIGNEVATAPVPQATGLSPQEAARVRQERAARRAQEFWGRSALAHPVQPDPNIVPPPAPSDEEWWERAVNEM